MPVILGATMLTVFGFVVYTGLVIIMAFGLFVFVLPSRAVAFVDVVFAVSCFILWIVACAGVVSGITTVWDPTPKRALIITGYAGISWTGLFILFGSFW